MASYNPNGIPLPSNITLLAQLLIDFRGSFKTIVDMASFDENYLASGQITYCLEDKQLYIYDKDNPLDPVFGRWTPLGGGSAAQSLFLIAENYTDLCTNTPSIQKIAYVKTSEVNAVDGKVYSSGFYIWNVTDQVWNSLTDITTAVNKDINYNESIEITEGSPESINCTKIIQKNGNEVVTIVVANQDSSDPSKIKAGDTISIVKQINEVVIYEYNILDDNTIHDPFA